MVAISVEKTIRSLCYGVMYFLIVAVQSGDQYFDLFI